MSEENVEVVRKSLEDFNAFMRGEMSRDAYARQFDPEIDVHWHDQQTYPDTPQHLRGAGDLAAFSEEYRDGWADLTAEALELAEAPGERVIGLIRQTGRGRQSGVPIEIHYFGLWTVRDGKLSELEYFRHRAEAPPSRRDVGVGDAGRERRDSPRDGGCT